MTELAILCHLNSNLYVSNVDSSFFFFLFFIPSSVFQDTLNGDPDHLSLAVVYLPTAKLPTLRFHNSFLPVLVSSILPADFDDAVALQAAEDDWDLLCVPADKTLNIDETRSPIFDSNKLLHITSEQAYGVFHDIGRETKKVTLKPMTEQVKSVNAVTLYFFSPYTKNDSSSLNPFFC